jgi:predicted Zn-dependent protease
MGARGADEGRSFFSKAGGGTLIGEQLADSRVNIYSDPSDTKAPSSPFSWDGGTKTVDELIASSEYAVLVTRFWYIRTVDPKTMLLTGLTRDGVFEIKDGKITRPVKNFRFNESPMNILKNISELGAAEKAVGSETDDFPIHVPAMKVDNFNFSSLSDAI